MTSLATVASTNDNEDQLFQQPPPRLEPVDYLGLADYDGTLEYLVVGPLMTSTLTDVLTLCHSSVPSTQRGESTSLRLLWTSPQKRVCFGTSDSRRGERILAEYYRIFVTLEDSSLPKYSISFAAVSAATIGQARQHHPHPSGKESLEIHGKSAKDAIDFLNDLLQLPLGKRYFDKVTIAPRGVGHDEEAYIPTHHHRHNNTHRPFRGKSYLNVMGITNLEKLLQVGECNKNSSRRHRQTSLRRVFDLGEVEFTNDQSHVLATVGKNTELCFRNNEFQDEAKSFLAGLYKPLQPGDDNDRGILNGPSALRFEGGTRIPFESDDWFTLLASDRLSAMQLTFHGFPFDTEFGQALIDSKAKGLAFENCSFEDCGRAIVESMRRHNTLYNNEKAAGTASTKNQTSKPQQDRHVATTIPKRELELEEDTFGQDPDSWIAFFEALSEDKCHLSRLRIGESFLFSGSFARTFMDHLHFILPTNRSLQELSCETPITAKTFANICNALASHPNLTRIKLIPAQTPSVEIKKVFCQLLQRLLERNSVLEDIPFYESFDQNMFDTEIRPRLVWNKYRKRFHEYQAYHLKDATLATALGQVSWNPSLLYALLVDHSEIVVNSLRDDGQ